MEDQPGAGVDESSRKDKTHGPNQPAPPTASKDGRSAVGVGFRFSWRRKSKARNMEGQFLTEI